MRLHLRPPGLSKEALLFLTQTAHDLTGPSGPVLAPPPDFGLADIGLPVDPPGSLPVRLSLTGHQQMLCAKEENMLIEISFS